MSIQKPLECVNPTYQGSDDEDSHHYIEPMEWVSGQGSHDLYGSQTHVDPDVQEDRSAGLRQRAKISIRDELPSRNIDIGQTVDNESDQGDVTIKRHNSNLTAFRYRSGMIRQMDENSLFEILNSDPDATSEQVMETLRSMNQSLTLKRQVKEKLSREEARQKHKAVSFSKRVKYNFAMTWQHLKQEVWTLLQSIDLWHSHLKAVQGHFGSGVASYFFFLRRLFYLNLLACILIVCFVVIPQVVWDNSQPSSKHEPFRGYELLTGDGAFGNTVLYYGHYTNNSVAGYKIPEAYFFTYTTYIILCIFILTFSVAKTYRVNYIETAGELKNVFAPKLLAAWDYTIERESSARLKSRSIYNELVELIAGQSQEKEMLNFSKRCCIYFWRILINLLVLAGMVATGYLVNWLLKRNDIRDVNIYVLKDISVALVVTGILFVVPFVFSLMSNWEQYSSKQTQIYLNIVRVVILRTVILGVVVSFWLTGASVSPANATSTSGNNATALNSTKEVCWETQLGQEIYRLIIIDFLCILLLPTFVMELLRRLFYDHCCKWVGYPEFDIAQNTLDLVYTQMLVWVGFFYSPLLPIIALAKLFIIFYVKRLSVIQFCNPPLKAWRAAHAQTLFLTLTFLCFMLSLISLGYSILQINSSNSCGPFRDLVTVYNVVLNLIDASSENSAKYLNKFLSPGVVAGVLLLLCVIVYYMRATAKAHMDMVKLLREQLILEGKDKVFLLRLFESAMEHAMLNSGQPNVINRGNSDTLNLKENTAHNSMSNVGSSNEWTQHYYPDGSLRRNRLAELRREDNPGSSSTSRESSPFGSENHRINARDSPPYLQPGGAANRYSHRDTSPYSGPSYPSPQGSMDRRGSQASQKSHRVNQVPLFMKPTHQHGFRNLTPGPQNHSRQSTPQRF